MDDGISRHSIRVGEDQDNLAAGEARPMMMRAYRWRDYNTVMRYGAPLAAKGGASASLAKRFAGDVSENPILSIAVEALAKPA